MSVRSIKAKAEAGFTLVELMIVVVIIGILAAVAIPQFNKFQLRSKHAEAGAVLLGIAKAEDAFGAKWSAYGEFLAQPTAAPSGGAKGAWVCASNNTGSCLIGYSPTGRVAFQYGALAGITFGTFSNVAFGAGAADAVLGTDASGFACMVCATSVGAVQADPQTTEMRYTGRGDIDGDGTSVIYGATDASYEALINPQTGGETVF